MTSIRNKKAFSLVELLVVITIIAILSVTAYVALGGQTAKARNSKRMQDLSTIQSALEVYFVNNENKYPAADTATTPPSVKTTAPDLTTQYLSNLPKDPSKKAGNPNYYYAVSTNLKTYLLATTLEAEDGGTGLTAYVIGNGTDLLTAGLTFTVASATCAAPACTVADKSTACVPYCL